MVIIINIVMLIRGFERIHNLFTPILMKWCLICIWLGVSFGCAFVPTDGFVHRDNQWHVF